MDTNFDTMFIDEPELGLGPRIQSSLSAFLANRAERDRFFPHLRSVTVATHSHLFLDRSDINNNFIVSKAGNSVTIDRVDSFTKFHTLQFNLLGNSLESLFLPAAFLLVEGKTDQLYLERWIQLRFPGRNILLTQTLGDPKKRLHTLRDALGDIFKSPFRGRIFPVLDSAHTRGDPDALEAMGVPRDQIVIWERNGIEYLYPPKLMGQIFGCAPEQISSLRIENDEVELNGVKRKKYDLCQEVVRLMTPDVEPPRELEAKLLSRLSTAIL